MHSDPRRDKVIDAARDFFAGLEREARFVPGETYVPVTAKCLDVEDLENLIHAALDLHLTAGRFSNELEKTLAASLGRSTRAVLLNSGSSANLVAVSALCSPLLKNFDLEPLRPGDEVITVAAGFPTTVNPIVQNQLMPVFVDVELDTLNTNLELIERALTPKTRAVVLAHTLGNPFRADLIAAWCREKKLYLVEDCCDALGAELNDQRVGSFGAMATLSFYPAHHMTTGEGGALIAENRPWQRVTESLRDWGRNCWCETGKDNTCQKRFDWKLGDLPCGYDHKYIYSQIGYNLKMTDMQAAIGLSQLKKLKQFIARRRANWVRLRHGLTASLLLREYFSIVKPTDDSNPSWFGFALHCHERVDRRELMMSLEKRRVGSRVLFAGDLTRQPAYQNAAFRVNGPLTNTRAITSQTFWLGVHPGLDDQRLDYILEQLEAATREQVGQ